MSDKEEAILRWSAMARATVLWNHMHNSSYSPLDVAYGLTPSSASHQGPVAFKAATWNSELSDSKEECERHLSAIIKSPMSDDLTGYAYALIAAVHGDLTILDQILSTNSMSVKNVNTRPSLMHWAVMMNVPEVIVKLAKAGVSLNDEDQNRNTPLFLALASTDKEDPQHLLLKALIQSGVDINLPHKTGVTPIKKALLINKTEKVEILMESGADITLKTGPTHDFLTYVIYAGNERIFKKLLKTNPEFFQSDDSRSINSAVMKNRYEMLKAWPKKEREALLKKHGQDFIESAIISCVNTGRESFDWLLQKVENLSGLDVLGYNLVGSAALSNDPYCAQQLLEKGLDINHTTPLGWSALLRAANLGHVKTMSYLLHKGANPHQVTADGENLASVINISINSSVEAAAEMIRLLINTKVDMGHRNKHGESLSTRLKEAGMVEHAEWVQSLIEKTALEKNIDPPVPFVKISKTLSL